MTEVRTACVSGRELIQVVLTSAPPAYAVGADIAPADRARTSMDDRRNKPRLSVSLNAMWDSSTEAHSARVTDLSEGGCYLDSVGEVRLGEIVGFRVLMPDDDWLYLEGEVRHQGPSGFGVQFVDLNEEQREKLDWLLRIAKEAGPGDAPISADLVEE